MIYLTNGNKPLNAAYEDRIVQEDGSTYQLTFRFPTSDPLWEKLKEETFLTADDLHGEQDFVIFEVKKKNGYIQVYANQVFTLLNNYVVNPISLDRQTGSTALSRFAGSITRSHPFSFFSDISERHTFNIDAKNAMEAFAKDKHSIIGQWGGDLVRHGYQVRLLKNGGSENESLFMYKKNLSSYQHKTSTKSLKTRITFKTTVKGEGEKAPDRKFSVVVDSPLINKYSQIYEDVIEVNDEDVKDEASLRKYGEQYFKTSLCDMMEDSLELEVVGQSDVPVQMYDIVSLFYEVYNLDVRKKITKYTYSPMANKLLSIGFGRFKSGLSNMVSNAVSDAVKNEAQQLHDDFERQLERELKNADLAFDRQKEELVNQFTDGLNAAKARAEEVKQELSDTINQRFSSFDNGPLQEVKRKAEEALRNAGASSLLAQEAKRIGLDSVAKLEEFKRQTTSAQTALSGDLDALKRTIANDIRPKQAQAEAEIAKQVEALIQTKKELAGVKSAQSTYEETTTRRLAELTNLANGKASKSEVVQTAEELRSRIASVQVGGINLLRNTASLLIGNRSKGYWISASGGNGRAISVEVLDPPQKMIKNMIRVIENTNGGNKDLTQLVRLRVGEKYTISCYARVASDSPNTNVNLLFRSWANETDLNRKFQKSISHKNWQKYSFTFTADAIENSIQFGQSGPGIIEICAPKIESGTLATDYSENPEDVGDRVSAVESTFKQRADSLEAGVNRLTEGLRTKADISSLNVTAENIRQSVKSLETSTQNKLDQKLSTAEFDVRANRISQEIINATKDKADRALVTAEAGKLREELASLQASGRNLFLNSLFKQGILKTGISTTSIYTATIDNTNKYLGHNALKIVGQDPAGKDGGNPKITYPALGQYGKVAPGSMTNQDVTISFYAKAEKAGTILQSRLGYIGFRDGNVTLTTEVKRYVVKFSRAWTGLSNLTTNEWLFNLNRADTVWIWMPKFEVSDTDTSYSEAPEDVEGLITEAKATFERTAQGLRTDLSTVQDYINKDGQRKEELQSYSREESARQVNAVRELIARDYVGKSTHQEDVRGIERRFEAITNPQNGTIATQIANYKQSVDGRFAGIISQIATKANQIDFQKVRETSQLYERILGNTDNGIANNVARMALTNQLFQVEVSKAARGGRNYIRNGQFKNGSKNWLEHQSVDFGLNFNYQHSQNPNNRNRPGLHFYHESQDVANFFGIQQSFAFDGVRGEKVSVSLLVSKDGGDANSGLKVALHYIKNKNIIGQEWQNIPSPQITSKYKRFTFTFTLSDDVENLNLMLYGEKGKTINLYVTDVQLERGSVATDYKEAPEDTDEAIRTVQNQLAGSWSVQNLTSAGSIVSQINATNNQILIEAEKIRLKGKTLLDELTAIQGYFKRLFVGEGAFATLNTDILRANSITADKLVMDQAMARRFVSSDIFTDTLAAKEAFINKLRSVVVTATLLEGYKGRIGGFQIGTHEKDSSVYWITGQNQFSVGMSNGSGQWSQTALWVNWGNNWGFPGDYAWYVKNNGKMYCYNTAEFWNTPVIHGNLRVTGHIYYNNENSGKSGHWIHSSKYSNFEPSNNYLYLYYSGSGYDWIPMNKEISDRRYKHNIEASTVSGLDVIESLKTYSYRKEYDGRIEDISCGIMAQDVQKYAPEAFFENPDGAYSYNTFALVPYLIKAIQELNQKIEKLEKTA